MLGVRMNDVSRLCIMVYCKHCRHDSVIGIVNGVELMTCCGLYSCIMCLKMKVTVAQTKQNVVQAFVLNGHVLGYITC